MLLAVVALLAAPVMTRGPMLVGVTSESVWIVWETSDKQANATVKFGSDTGSYTGSAQDSSYSADHHVQLPGLLPGATYHYTVDTDAKKQDSSFTTAPAGATVVPIKFVVYGDNRTNTADHQKIANATPPAPTITF